VNTFFSYLLISLVLLQTFSREVLVVDFTLHRVSITARYCVNKDRPMLHCDGKCYFAKQLSKQQERESKLPNALKERLEMLPTAFSGLVPVALVRWATAPIGYSSFESAWLPDSALQGIFHPPQV
jgi:hypothetical protein